MAKAKASSEYTLATTRTEVRTHIVCPCCKEGVLSSTVDHMYKQAMNLKTPHTPFGPWECEACGAGIMGDIVNGQVYVKPYDALQRTLKTLVLLRSAHPFDGKEYLYTVVEGLFFQTRADAEVEWTNPTFEELHAQNHAYYYEEHTCPINFLGAKVFILGDDADPHGIFEFVEVALPSPEHFVDCDKTKAARKNFDYRELSLAEWKRVFRHFTSEVYTTKGEIPLSEAKQQQRNRHETFQRLADLGMTPHFEIAPQQDESAIKNGVLEFDIKFDYASVGYEKSAGEDPELAKLISEYTAMLESTLLNDKNSGGQTLGYQSLPNIGLTNELFLLVLGIRSLCYDHIAGKISIDELLTVVNDTIAERSERLKTNLQKPYTVEEIQALVNTYKLKTQIKDTKEEP